MGIGFETRLASGQTPNRTMASFIPGNHKKTRDNILVRGYWGDIKNSPYISFGNEVFKEPERTRFYKQVNYQKVYSNADISEYIV
jgi:dynein assembly factor 3